MWHNLSRRTLNWIIHFLEGSCEILAFEKFLWRSFNVHELLPWYLKYKIFLARILWSNWFLPRSFKVYTFLLRSLWASYMESSFSKDLGRNPYCCMGLESSFKDDAPSLKLFQSSYKIFARISFVGILRIVKNTFSFWLKFEIAQKTSIFSSLKKMTKSPQTTKGIKAPKRVFQSKIQFFLENRNFFSSEPHHLADKQLLLFWRLLSNLN